MEQPMPTEEQVQQTRSMVQNMAYRAWENAGRRATVVAATGFGKSKLAVRRVIEIGQVIYDQIYDEIPGEVANSILLVTPTEKLRDENWPVEFAKWNAGHYMFKLVKRICFASLKNEKGNHYRLVILDEIHRLTQLNAEGFKEEGTSLLPKFFSENMADEVMGLTATEPDPDRDKVKAAIIGQIAPVCFRYTLDQAVDDGLAPAYQIKVILVPLDRVTKNIPAGTKKQPFLNTEFASYEFLEKKCKVAFASKKQGFIQKMVGARMRFLVNLPSKTRVAKKVLEKVLPGKRTLVFCGSIEQSRQLCGENVYNSSAEDKKRDMLTAFKNQQIDYLGVCNAVNEGHNIDMLDQAVAVQINSNERDLVQRIGRLLRYRPGYAPIIYIIVAQGTQDQNWANSALDGFDRKRITYDSYLNYL